MPPLEVNLVRVSTPTAVTLSIVSTVRCFEEPDGVAHLRCIQPAFEGNEVWAVECTGPRVHFGCIVHGAPNQQSAIAIAGMHFRDVVIHQMKPTLLQGKAALAAQQFMHSQESIPSL